MRRAGSSTSLKVSVPARRSSASQASTAPGTLAASMPCCGIRPSFDFAVRRASVAPVGARPLPFSAMSFFSFASQAMTNTSPPIPALPGSTTFSAAAVATAASKALPPFSRICSPACAAIGWLVATMPLRASTSDRVCGSQPLARSPRTAWNVDWASAGWAASASAQSRI